MAITQDEIRLYQSERMTDNADGGGRMSSTVIVDDQKNNVFPDITEIERATGSTRLRKIFGAVISENNDAFMSSHMIVDVPPADPATTVLLFASGSYTEERSAVQLAPTQWGKTYTAPIFNTEYVGKMPGAAFVEPGAPTILWSEKLYSFPPGPENVPAPIPIVIEGEVYWAVTIDEAVYGSEAFARQRITINRPIPGLTTTAHYTGVMYVVGELTSILRPYGALPTNASASAGAASVRVGDEFAVNPYRVVAVVQPADLVLLHHTESTPATVSNGQTVTLARSNVDRIRVVNHDGTVYATFSRNVPPPSVGCTADLAAGTVTFSDVSGLMQPITIDDRIEMLSQVTAVAPVSGGTSLTFARALPRDFPAGSIVSSLLMTNDLQSHVTEGFAQTAWTGAWSNTVVGGSPLADFDQAFHPITLINKGAITDRWAIQFTNTTSFRCFGELSGDVGSGNTAVDFSPINSATGAPYFTVPATGWGTSWSSGNVFRFNTFGAQAPAWVYRYVAPSEEFGLDKVSIEFRGYINN